MVCVVGCKAKFKVRSSSTMIVAAKREKVLIDMRRKEKRNWSENNRKVSRSTSPTDVMCDFDWSNVGTATAITTACLMVEIDCH